MAGPDGNRQRRLRPTLTAAAVVMLGGITAGLVGAAMVAVMHLVELAAYGRHGTSLVQAAAPWRRILAPTLGGILAGLGWWTLRRGGQLVPLRTALHDPARRMGILRTTADALLQILLVGSGGSLGREGAPRQTSAVLAQHIARRGGVAVDLGPTILAAAAGAGLAAVYNVPVAGALFALEVLLVRWTPLTISISAAMSAIATVVAWPVVSVRPTYDFPAAAPQLGALWWTLVAVPLTALLGLGFATLAGVAERRRPRAGWRLPVAIGLTGALLGALSVSVPDLPGNGQEIMQTAFAGSGSAAGFLLLLVLKPLVTGLYVRSGAVGGLLTPALATGASAGGAAAWIVRSGGGQASVALWALIGAAGVLAVTQRAPLFAAAMAWELTTAPLWTVPLLLAVTYASLGGAHLVARRLRPRPPRPPRPPGSPGRPAPPGRPGPVSGDGPAGGSPASSR